MRRAAIVKEINRVNQINYRLQQHKLSNQLQMHTIGLGFRYVESYNSAPQILSKKE